MKIPIYIITSIIICYLSSCGKSGREPVGLFRSIEPEADGGNIEIDFQSNGQARFRVGTIAIPCNWAVEDDKVILTGDKLDKPGFMRWEGDDLILEPSNIRFKRIVAQE